MYVFNAEVPTENGPKLIQEIQVGERVFGLDDILEEVTAIHIVPPSLNYTPTGILVNIGFSTYREIVCTRESPFLNDGGEIIQAKDFVYGSTQVKLRDGATYLASGEGGSGAFHGGYASLTLSGPSHFFVVNNIYVGDYYLETTI